LQSTVMSDDELRPPRARAPTHARGSDLSRRPIQKDRCRCRPVSCTMILLPYLSDTAMKEDQTIVTGAMESLHVACRRVNLDSRVAGLVRCLSNAVFRLTSEPILARVTVYPAELPRLQNAVKTTRWLAEQDFPAVRPLDCDQPVLVGEHIVTFWP